MEKFFNIIKNGVLGWFVLFPILFKPIKKPIIKDVVERILVYLFGGFLWGWMTYELEEEEKKWQETMALSIDEKY